MVRRRKIDRTKPLHTQPLAFHLFSIGHGLPHPPYACVGLSPKAVHPRGRAPLQPSIPLPWPDCYVHPFKEFAATITRMHVSPATPVSTVTKEEHLSVLGYLFEDSATFIREQERDDPSTDSASNSATSSVTLADDSPAPSYNGRSSSPVGTQSGYSTDSEWERGSSLSASSALECCGNSAAGASVANPGSEDGSRSEGSSNGVADGGQEVFPARAQAPGDVETVVVKDSPML
ncbi:hypothetical protein AURDEDRAFT_125984 [Auricularia subglabra TFB-10046 SS5]|nr:hypothetical protein AURDEDRAFT_125984 [Auricularia subglabra TFB-10046 SS5]